MRLSDEKSLLEQMTIEQARQNIALLKAEEIEMPKKWVLELLNTIEVLQAENEQLKADCDRMLCEVQELTMEYNRFKERLQISPYGDDKIDELDEALENYKFQYEQLKQENEQLQAQVARMREALTIANNYMPDIGQFCTCGKCKKCETDINYAGYGYCLKCARNIIDAALSDTPADYHLKAELARYKLEAEKIPNICYKYRYDPDECVPNDECPQICSKWKNKDESIK